MLEVEAEVVSWYRGSLPARVGKAGAALCDTAMQIQNVRSSRTMRRRSEFNGPHSVNPFSKALAVFRRRFRQHPHSTVCDYH